ncbi:MAG: metallophosphatase family protein [Chitinophagales bacterium]|nr:metallophosphatase family protein [Chitinophagales bacterium]MDW8419581.1 metallophosphoesterase family protein [Chitinophagales bacterium]
MWKIGLLSDTHGHTDPKIFEVFKDVDEIWHAGDIGDYQVCRQLATLKKPIVAVHGNIDDPNIRALYPEAILHEREGVKILMIHIGGYPGRYAAKARKLIELHRPQLFICGHSHILKVMRDDRYGLLSVNPGAAGIQGMHTVKTVLRLQLQGGKVVGLEAVELGKRGAIV